MVAVVSMSWQDLVPTAMHWDEILPAHWNTLQFGDQIQTSSDVLSIIFLAHVFKMSTRKVSSCTRHVSYPSFQGSLVSAQPRINFLAKFGTKVRFCRLLQAKILINALSLRRSCDV